MTNGLALQDIAKTKKEERDKSTIWDWDFNKYLLTVERTFIEKKKYGYRKFILHD